MAKAAVTGTLTIRPPRPSRLHKWYSICSKHQRYRPDCHYCQGGKWYFEPWSMLDRLHFKIAPKHWIKRANRG